MSSGVYAICNKENGKQYIGSSVTIEKRWNEHKRELEKGVHHNRYLQKAWDKHGRDLFEFIILEDSDEENLLQTEQKYLDDLETYERQRGYNIHSCADSPRGRKWTEEQKKHLSEIRKATSPRGKDHWHFMGEASAETREKMSRARKGKKLSLEHRQHISRKGKDHWAFGRTTPAETRQKQSLALKGRKFTPEHSQKKSLAQTGEKNPQSKLTEDQVREIKKRLIAGETPNQLAKEYPVCRESIRYIRDEKIWKHVKVQEVV